MVPPREGEALARRYDRHPFPRLAAVFSNASNLVGTRRLRSKRGRHVAPAERGCACAMPARAGSATPRCLRRRKPSTSARPRPSAAWLMIAMNLNWISRLISGRRGVPRREFERRKAGREKRIRDKASEARRSHPGPQRRSAVHHSVEHRSHRRGTPRWPPELAAVRHVSDPPRPTHPRWSSEHRPPRRKHPRASTSSTRRGTADAHSSGSKAGSFAHAWNGSSSAAGLHQAGRRSPQSGRGGPCSRRDHIPVHGVLMLRRRRLAADRRRIHHAQHPGPLAQATAVGPWLPWEH